MMSRSVRLKGNQEPHPHANKIISLRLSPNLTARAILNPILHVELLLIRLSFRACVRSTA